MSNNLSRHTLGLTQLQSGQGVPTHQAELGSLYINVLNADYYKNTDGFTTWVLITAGGGGGGGLSGDTYVTGFTYSNNVLTISQNQGQPPLTVTIDSFTGLTVYGSFSASTYLGISTTDYYVTGGTYLNGVLTLSRQNGEIIITGFTTSCLVDTESTYGLEYKKISTISGLDNGSYIIKSYLTSFSGSSKYGFWERTLGVVTTGGTPIITQIADEFDSYSSNFLSTQVVYVPTVSNTVEIYISGLTSENLNWTSYYDFIGQNCGGGGSSITSTDFYVTGGTFNSGTNTLTLDRQNGSVNISGFTSSSGGIQVNDLFSYQFLLMGA